MDKKLSIKGLGNYVPQSTQKLGIISRCVNEESILGSIDSGFGFENTLIKDNPKPTYKTHLCKESYLGEFKSEFEKALARNNLDVYSKEETLHIITGLDFDFVTKEDLEESVKNLDYTTSVSEAYVDYEIPDNLFRQWQ